MLPFLRKRLADPIVKLLTQGVAPKQIALSLAVGAVVGIFPSLGWPSLLCFGASIAFGLNLTALQIANFAAYPLQLALLIPFLRLGEIVFHVSHTPWSLAQIISLIHQSIPHAIAVLWTVTIHAIAVWVALAAPLIFVLYLLLTPVVAGMARVVTARTSTPNALAPECAEDGSQ